jgi:hypothetical protein
MKKYKLRKIEKNEEEQSGLNEESLKTFQTHIKNIYEGDGSNFIINTELIEPSYNIYRELMANYRIEKEPNNKGTTIIPLDFNITLDGLSGIIPSSSFFSSEVNLYFIYLSSNPLDRLDIANESSPKVAGWA